MTVAVLVLSLKSFICLQISRVLLAAHELVVSTQWHRRGWDSTYHWRTEGEVPNTDHFPFLLSSLLYPRCPFHAPSAQEFTNYTWCELTPHTHGRSCTQIAQPLSNKGSIA